jgi:DNA-binding NtrC family response regulator
MADTTQHDVLILNQDKDATRELLKALAARGVRGCVVREGRDALARLREQRWDLVVADLELVRNQVPQLVQVVRENDPELDVVAMGPGNNAAEAVEAVNGGCRDFLVKPIDPDRLDELLDEMFPIRPADARSIAATDEQRALRIAGRDERFLDVLRLARKVAPTSAAVLITGESGTGKELISRYVHNASRRAGGPYVKVNCAALSESLLESELFGHERGAFTGAYRQRQGRFERAHGGSLLLDEISETGPRLQAELLRVLEDQDFERLGGSEPVRVNVRIISTSNRDLFEEVSRNRFRADLFYRICGLHLHVPPLRERPGDIPILVGHFVNQFAREGKRRIEGVDSEMLELFSRYDWPGNVRQLRNVIRTALILGEGDTLSLDHAPQLLRQLASPSSRPAATLSLAELERQAVLEALRRTGSHQARAAKLLGISDRTLREKVRRYRRDGYVAERTTGAEDADDGETERSLEWQDQTA